MVCAVSVSLPAETLVDNENDASAEFASPEASDAVQFTVTSAPYQIDWSGTVQLIVGACASALVITSVAQFGLPVMVNAPAFPEASVARMQNRWLPGVSAAIVAPGIVTVRPSV